MRTTNMARVSHRHRCPICGKPDWCMIARDGSAAICPRVPEGSRRYIEEVGYLHILNGAANFPAYPRTIVYDPPQEPEPTIDAPALCVQFQDALSGVELAEAAFDLGVSQQSLLRLRMGYHKPSGAHTFPMCDDDGNCIGIRLRCPKTGRKWAIRGSRSGLFFPLTPYTYGTELLICEGPTDTAAMLTLGFHCLGRPFCRGGTESIIKIAKGLEAHVVIVADSDPLDKFGVRPGMQGATKLAEALFGHAGSVKVITPMRGKDARKWVQTGATREIVEAVIENSPLFQRKEAA